MISSINASWTFLHHGVSSESSSLNSSTVAEMVTVKRLRIGRMSQASRFGALDKPYRKTRCRIRTLSAPKRAKISLWVARAVLSLRLGTLRSRWTTHKIRVQSEARGPAISRHPYTWTKPRSSYSRIASRAAASRWASPTSNSYSGPARLSRRSSSRRTHQLIVFRCL